MPQRGEMNQPICFRFLGGSLTIDERIRNLPNLHGLGDIGRAADAMGISWLVSWDNNSPNPASTAGCLVIIINGEAVESEWAALLESVARV